MENPSGVPTVLDVALTIGGEALGQWALTIPAGCRELALKGVFDVEASAGRARVLHGGVLARPVDVDGQDGEARPSAGAVLAEERPVDLAAPVGVLFEPGRPDVRVRVTSLSARPRDAPTA